MKTRALSFITLGCLATQAQAASPLDQWVGTGPFANGQGNQVVTALAVSADGMNAYAGTGSGTVLHYATSDAIPNAFSFSAQNGVALSTVATSNAITVAGINTSTTIGITGGTYSVNGSAYTAGVGSVNNGDTVTVRQTSSGSYGTATTTTLTIGGISGAFSVTTQAAPTAPVTDTPTIPTLPITITVPGVPVVPPVVNVTAGIGPSFMEDLVAMLAKALNQPLRYQEQNVLGTVILSGYNGGNLAFVPSNFQAGGDTRANGIYAVGDGRYQVVRNGQSLTITPSVVRLDQLTALSPGLSANIGDNGVIVATIDGVTYAVQPSVGVQLEPASGTARLTMGADGYWHFIDALGNHQILYPAYADVPALRNALWGLDPSASVAIQLDGTAAVVFNRLRYTLVPDIRLIRVPTERAGQYWWQDGAMHFWVSNAQPLGSAQGFTAQP